MTRSWRPRRATAALLAVLALTNGVPSVTATPASAVAAPAPPASVGAPSVPPAAAGAAQATASGWTMPLPGAQVIRPFLAPPHAYGPGHRGVDLAATDTTTVVAPADGVVLFSGTVVDRTVLTIDHGNGYVSTVEPVTDPPPAGTVVRQGEPVGSVSEGGHAAPGALHFGLRLNGEYVNPLVVLGLVERAILLPCC